jgi:hypothetical protein
MKRFLGIFLLSIFPVDTIVYAFDAGLLAGTIEGQRYTAVKNRFSVEIPYLLDERTRDQILIKERTNAALSNVTISHSLPYRPVFRMEIAKVAAESEREKPFELAAYETISWYQRLIESSFKSSITMLDDKVTTFENRPSVFNLFRIIDPQTAYSQYHVFYLTDYSSHIGFCWVNFTIKKSSKEIESKLLSGDWPLIPRIEQFCRSLKIGS